MSPFSDSTLFGETIVRSTVETMSITIPCIPPTATSQQKGAVRTSVGIRFFKKARVQRAENTLLALLSSHAPPLPYDGPLHVEVLWSFPWRKSESKRNRALGNLSMGVRPDCDNIMKLLGDAMTTLRFWNDDSQIAELYLRKQWGDWTGIKIEIRCI